MTNGYELIDPNTGKPCGVFVCKVCGRLAGKDFVEQCCKLCECGAKSRNRFEGKCSDCWNEEYKQRKAKQLEEAELVEWDGSMIFSEEVSGCRDGWFDSPDDLRDYCAGEEDDDFECPEFAFLGRKCVKTLDIDRALEWMTEDTCEDAELHVAKEDMKELNEAVSKFNAKYAVTYYEHEYKRKVRVTGGDHDGAKKSQ